jgi:dynein heavy chain 2
VPREGKEKLLVFFKIKPEIITLENLHENVFVSSMVDSPVSSLYHAIQKVYAPVLLKVRVCDMYKLQYEFYFVYLHK